MKSTVCCESGTSWSGRTAACAPAYKKALPRPNRPSAFASPLPPKQLVSTTNRQLLKSIDWISSDVRVQLLKLSYASDSEIFDSTRAPGKMDFETNGPQLNKPCVAMWTILEFGIYFTAFALLASERVKLRIRAYCDYTIRMTSIMIHKEWKI